MENEMTTRAQEVIKEQNAPVNPAEEKAKKSKLAQKKKNADFKARVQTYSSW
jgi:hypothetical protein